MAPAVFKTGEAEVLGLAGSIPVHLRHLEKLTKIRKSHLGGSAESHGDDFHVHPGLRAERGGRVPRLMRLDQPQIDLPGRWKVRLASGERTARRRLRRSRRPAPPWENRQDHGVPDRPR